MDRIHVSLALLGVLSVSFMLTGFQCGSPALTSAKLYIKDQDWPNAEKALITELQKNPANAEAWYTLGDVRLKLGNYSGMVDAYNKSLAIGPEFAKQIDNQKKYVWSNFVNGAVQLYKRIPDAPKDSVSILRHEAIANYDTAIVVFPDSTISYYNKSIALREEGKYDEEMMTLKAALDKKKDPELYASLINAYIHKAESAKASNNAEEAAKTYNDAISTLNEARALQPDNSELLSALINVYIESDRAKDALPLIREAVAKDPKNKTFQNDLGLLLMQTNEFEEAVQHFEAAIASDENYEDGLWNGAVAYMKWGDKIKKDGGGADADPKTYVPKFKSAVKLAEKLVGIKKDVAKYWEGLATAYANANMKDEAQKAFQQAEALQKK